MSLLKGTAMTVVIMIASPSSVYGEGVKVGAPPPTFVLIDENGEKVNIENLMDRSTIIYFTHNACHYCTQIIAHLSRAEAKFGKENLRIMGINVMAKDKVLVKAYKEEIGFAFPMFAGNRYDVLRAYNVNYVPVLIFIDKKKIVRHVVGHYIHEPELHRLIRETMGR